MVVAVVASCVLSVAGTALLVDAWVKATAESSGGAVHDGYCRHETQ